MQCRSCMIGTYVNGVCNHCGRPLRAPHERDALALPLDTLLHQRYFLGDVLGRGGFGITYAAWDTKLNQRVAIKELFPCRDVQRAPDHATVLVNSGQEQYFAQASHCFENEAKLLMQMQGHPGVVQIYHLFAENHTVYYVMEYLDGHDLHAYLQKNGPMRWDELTPILQPLLDALEKLHQKGLIHRDITPDNIFLTRDNCVRLIDFGSVRSYQAVDHFTVFIKKSFAPWEQYQSDGTQGPWTDIYSLSVTIYFALSGKLPPMASERRLHDAAIPLQTLCPNLPPHVASAVMYGMAVQPQARCQSAQALAALLFPKNQAAQHASTAYGGSTPRLICQRGLFAGHVWPLAPEQPIRIGRMPGCSIAYPPYTKGVSRAQCTVVRNPEGRILVRDEGSSYGTFLQHAGQRMRLEPGCWYYAEQCTILFGSEEEYLLQEG